jgi:hypothetical protein
MARYWLEFARKANPNFRGAPVEWPQYSGLTDVGAGSIVRFDGNRNATSVVVVGEKNPNIACDAWRNAYPFV